jgi:hypothetical protein
MMKKQLLITSISIVVVVGGLVGISHAAFTTTVTNSGQVQTVKETPNVVMQGIVVDKQPASVEDDHLSIAAVVPQVKIVEVPQVKVEAVQQVKVEEVPQVKVVAVPQVKVEADQQGEVDDDQQGNINDDQQGEVDNNQQDNVDDDQQDNGDNGED